MSEWVSSHADGGSALPRLCQKYIGDCVLSVAQKSDSDISPTPPLFLQGAKNPKFDRYFSTLRGDLVSKQGNISEM